MGTQESAKYGMRDGKLMNLTKGYEVKGADQQDAKYTRLPLHPKLEYDMGKLPPGWPK